MEYHIINYLNIWNKEIEIVSLSVQIKKHKTKDPKIRFLVVAQLIPVCFLHVITDKTRDFLSFCQTIKTIFTNCL